MVEEFGGLLLTDGRSRIYLHPPKPYPDGHGYQHQIDLVGGPFSGSIEASSYEPVDALRAFRDELDALYRALVGEASLSHAYRNLKLSLKGDGLGHINVGVHAVAGDLMNYRLSYTFTIDQTQLPAAIAAVESFLR